MRFRFNVPNDFRKKTILFLLILISRAVTGLAQEAKIWPDREYPYLILDNGLWIGTPRGLYHYHSGDDSWIHYDVPSSHVEHLFWDGDYIWIATPEGLASLDPKLQKWMRYSEGQGIPSNRINSLGLQGDYVWIATDKGAARFDKLILEWEWFKPGDGLDSLVYDIEVDGDKVYLATSRGLSEYDVSFEKWRHFEPEGTLSEPVRVMIQDGGYLWLFTPRGPLRFDKNLRSFVSFASPSLAFDKISDLIVEQGRFWAATEEGIILYDPSNNLWRPYTETLSMPKPIPSLAFSGTYRWFLTPPQVSRFDETTKTWQRYERVHGLSADAYERIITFSGQTFLIHPEGVDYTKPGDDRWYPFRFVDSKSSDSWLNPEKGEMRLSEGTRLSVHGTRVTGRRKWTARLEGEDFSLNTSDLFRGDVKLQLELPGERTFNLFYDNTDFSQVQLGGRYRGAKNDWIQEFNWGDLQHDPGKSLIPSVALYGISGRVEIGPKTDRYKRSLISIKGWEGEKTSGRNMEFFSGTSRQIRAEIRDIDYQKDRFFSLDPGFGLSKPVFFRDDRISSNNDANTIHAVLAGVEGDYDILRPIEDVSVIDSATVEFTRPLSGQTVVIGISDGTGETAVKEEGETGLVNRYFVGGTEILPYTLKAVFLDAAGFEKPLSDFGLDRDWDGRIDPEFVDYERGYIWFPDLTPFSSGVYDSENPISEITMRFEFMTERDTYPLSRKNLVRGSEKVTVDGNILQAGSDYIVDATVGVLIIVREGLVGEDSEIEVTYDYIRSTRERFFRAGAAFGPSDNLLAETHVFQYDAQEGDSSGRSVRGFDSSGEVRIGLMGLDVKLSPQFARTYDGNRSGNGMNLRADISSRKLRLFAVYEKEDSTFEVLHEKQFQLGRIGSRGHVGITYYPWGFLDASAQWKRTTAQDAQSLEEEWSGKLLFNRERWPVLSLSYRERRLESGEEESGGNHSNRSLKSTWTAGLEYQVPAELAGRLGIRTMRVLGSWRASRDRTYAETRIVNNGYFRLDFTPLDRVQFYGTYRRESSAGRELLHEKEKWFFDVTIDRLRGLNASLRYSAEWDAGLIPSTSRRLIRLDREMQASVRVFPGQWIRFLAPFSFECNIQPVWRGAFTDSEDLEWTELFWRPKPGRMNIGESTTFYQLRGEYRPWAFLSVYTGWETADLADNIYLTSRNGNLNRWNHKIEFQPFTHTVLVLHYLHSREEGATTRIRHQPLFWMENRWASRFQTKWTVSWLKEEEITGVLRSGRSTLSPLLGLTLRIPGKSGPVAEIRNDISASWMRSIDSGTDQNRFSNSLGVDWYPWPALIARLRLNTSLTQVESNPDNILDNSVELRITVQI